MAGRVGSSGSGVFSAAISQSPVSDWLYYGRCGRVGGAMGHVTHFFSLDSIYTERYMIKPYDNWDAYKVST